MSISMILVIVLGFGLAYVNGANDVSKGIATLVGSGVTNYRRAIMWGALWTAAGGLLGAAFAKAMVTTFGKGLLTVGTTPTLTAAMATVLGAAAWVLLATRTSLPVSTTHAIVGSISGVAAVAYGLSGVQWSALGGKILVPLLVSPLVSLSAVVLVLRTTREACAVERPEAFRLTTDHLHWLTSGATSFARGMNDAPKIVALVLAAAALQGSTALLSTPLLFALVAGGMVAGSLVSGVGVTQFLAERVTPMDHREGFVANLVTASLVTMGATLGVPMSTTHVASGGIVGAGAQRSSLHRKTLRDVALAWLVTLPASALFGIAAYFLAKVAIG